MNILTKLKEVEEKVEKLYLYLVRLEISGQKQSKEYRQVMQKIDGLTKVESSLLIDTKDYYDDMLLHETMHFCGSGGASALKEGINELITRKIALKKNFKTNGCGYPKEVKIAYELQNIFGEEVLDQIAFINSLPEICYFLDKTLGSDASKLYQDITFSNIRLDFEHGKVVNAESGSTTSDLNRILDTDSGARYVGEFAFGTNPKITRIVKNIIYDEKMLGSIHFALGASHPTSNNGNSSGIHWDMVQIHKKGNGGGQIFFDDELIMQDGIFIPQDLQSLNQSKVLKLKR